MHIDPVLSFDETLQQARSSDLKLLLWEKSAESRQPESRRPARPSRLFIMIGPEGGFELQEVHRARQEGFLAVGMGPRILRAQTAILSAAVIAQFVFGDMHQNFLDNPQAV